MSPLCENYLRPEQLNQAEPFYPLHVRVCERCFLVQVEEYVSPAEIFSDYAYFSSYSDSWVRHAGEYAELVIDRLGLGGESFVLEVASNDGYLLQHLVERGIPSLGVEPAANVVEAARARGVETLVAFFDQRLAAELAVEHRQADLVVGNNVLAQVPALNDFVAGIRIVLAPRGVLTLEFPHLMRLIEGNQFDTLYHEHFSYFSFLTAKRLLASHGLVVFDVDELPTHGGSLRLWAQPCESRRFSVTPQVRDLAARERAAGYDTTKPYSSFSAKVEETKRGILDFLIHAKREGKTIVGYGAPGKGNTLLNYCGIRTDFVDYTVDRNPHKQGLFLPGTHIPIRHPDAIGETRPDYILILPWNLKDEVVQQLSYARGWGARFVVPIPAIEVL